MGKTGCFAGWLLLSCAAAGGCAHSGLLAHPETVVAEPVASTADPATPSGSPLPEPAAPAARPAGGHVLSASEAGELARVRAAAAERGLSDAQAEQLVNAVRSTAPEHRHLLLAHLTSGDSSTDDTPAMLPLDESPVPELPLPADKALTDRSPASDQRAAASDPSAESPTERPGPTHRSATEQAARPAAESPPAGPAEPRRPPPAAATQSKTTAPAADAVAEQQTSNHTETAVTDHAAPVAPPAAGGQAASPVPAVQRPAATLSVADDPASAATPPAAVTVGDEQAARPPAGDADWREAVRDAIEALRVDLQNDSLAEADRSRLQTMLALLHVVAEQHEQGVELLDGYATEQELEFWRQQILGLGILLNCDGLPKFKYRVESAAECLRQGQRALTVLGPLTLKNLAFCTKVSGFGDFTEFESYVFRPGQQVLLYVELENFTVEQVEVSAGHVSSVVSGLAGPSRVPMYETELQGRYEILAADQRPVVSRTLPLDRNRCRNHRSDYFIPYLLRLPEKIQPGTYTLELIIEDKKGGKFGSGVIEFRTR